MNSNLPMTLFTNDAFLKVASPKSPSFSKPVVPVMKILSHFKSRWIMAGVLVWRKFNPRSIWRHQFTNIFSLTTLKRRIYLNNIANNILTANMSMGTLDFNGLIYWNYIQLTAPKTAHFHFLVTISLSQCLSELTMVYLGPCHLWWKIDFFEKSSHVFVINYFRKNDPS